MNEPTQRSNRRQRQAEFTRQEILAAARKLFAEKGYAATTVRDIAEEAGAAVQTVYAAVGSKSELVRGLNDLVDEKAGIGAIVANAMQSDDPTTPLLVSAGIARTLFECCGDILRVVVDGAASEPDLAELLREGDRRHRAGVAGAMRRAAELGALKDTHDLAQATLTVAALTDISFVLMLVDRYGLSADEAERWMGDAILSLVGVQKQSGSA
ncbi:MAG: TetR/AcrR family transcriptional regulator [Dehalococcoidia bacterium]